MLRFQPCLIAVIGVVLGTGPLSNKPFKPVAKLYEFPDATGDSYELVAMKASDLYGFNDRAHAVCLTGVWIFYFDGYFNGDGDAPVEFIYAPDFTCLDFKILAGQVSSARYVGHPRDFTKDSITFYEGPNFQGADEWVRHDKPTLSGFDRAQGSFIITGKTGWTLYDEPEYFGEAVCVFPPASASLYPGFFTDMEELTVPIPYGKVASVRNGCFSEITTSKP